MNAPLISYQKHENMIGTSIKRLEKRELKLIQPKFAIKGRILNLLTKLIPRKAQNLVPQINRILTQLTKVTSYSPSISWNDGHNLINPQESLLR